MKNNQVLLIAVAFFSLLPTQAYSSKPVAQETPLAQASPVPTPTVSAPTLVQLGLDPKVLIKEFQKAQKSEIKALEHRYEFELKELKASQSTRMKEWKDREEKARHLFFEQHGNGPERRLYIQDFMRRRDELNQANKEEIARRLKEQSERVEAVRSDQLLKLTGFKSTIEKGFQPSANLWPRPGN